MAIIKKKKLADAVIDEIGRMIENGELKEGDKLPNQDDFANQLQVSRTSLREALRILDLLGAIEQRPGFGTVIKKYNPVLFTNTITVPPLMADAQGTIELIKARQIIEVGAAELAAENVTDDQIEILSGLTEELSQTLKEESLERYIQNDISFHSRVSEFSNNRFIIYSFENIKMYIQQYMHEFFKMMPGLLNPSEKFHRSIFNYIAAKNPAKARQAMKEHIDTIHKNYLLYMKKTQ